MTSNLVFYVCFFRGGWVAAHITRDLSDDVVCGVIPHPSIHLEDFAWKKSGKDLVGSSKRPILLMPAGMPSFVDSFFHR
jgi:hypothetical protein